jgi:CRP-like cAMP-binding protein
MPTAEAAAFFQRHCAYERAGGDTLVLPSWNVDAWARLLAHAEPVALGTGDVLIKRGDDERAMFLVASGALEVASGEGRGAMGRMSRELPGSVVGEISFFDGRPRTATVWATEPTMLLRLERTAVERFAAAHPAQGLELLWALGRVLAARVRRGETRRSAQTY